jgi:dihydroneopterin aldolase
MKKVLFIDELVIMARLGLHDFEKEHVQPVLIDLEVGFLSVGQGLKNTQNYSYIGELIQKHMKTRDYDLVEDLAEDVWRLLSEAQVDVLRLKATKLNPPCYESRVKIEKVSCVISR